MSVTYPQLSSYVGKPISALCQNNFTSPAQNHCAHFVSHAHGIKLGMLCGDMSLKTRHTGASIRCDELYNRLINRGPWAKRPLLSDGLLVFVTSARHVLNGVMANVPQKHVGIFFSGKVFNFSNSHHQVVVDTSVDAFHKKFEHTYAGGDISLFYGVAP
jgi:hypothetical protein